MRDWQHVSTVSVELSQVTPGNLTNVLEEFAYEYDVDPTPIIKQSSVILQVYDV